MEAVRKLQESDVCVELYRNIEQEKTEDNICIIPETFGYQRITRAQMRIWQIFLPKKYEEDQLKEYSFDVIPRSVLLEWETAKDLGLFQSFSIRTPEEKLTIKRVLSEDPILIAWFYDMPYIISRWGKSLKSFNEIKIRAWARKILEPVIGYTVLILSCCLNLWLISRLWRETSAINFMWCGYSLVAFFVVLYYLQYFSKDLKEVFDRKPFCLSQAALFFCFLLGGIFAVIGIVLAAIPLHELFNWKILIQWIIGILIILGIAVLLILDERKLKSQN